MTRLFQVAAGCPRRKSSVTGIGQAFAAQHTQERGFAGAVGADDGRDRTGGNGEGAMLPDDMVATLDGGIAEHDAIGSFTHNARLWQTMLTIVLKIVYGW